MSLDDLANQVHAIAERYDADELILEAETLHRAADALSWYAHATVELRTRLLAAGITDTIGSPNPGTVHVTLTRELATKMTGPWYLVKKPEGDAVRASIRHALDNTPTS